MCSPPNTTIKDGNGNEDGSSNAVGGGSSSSSMSFAKKALLASNFFVETNRMESFVAVYCITYAGWNEVMMGIISLATNVTMIVFQTPAGDLLDKTHHKKLITVASILTASVTTACVAWTTNFWVVLTAKIFEGVASTVFLPALMSILLGICATQEEVPSFVALTEVSNKVGSVLFTLGCGLVAYFLYPNLQAVFYLLGAGGLCAALAVGLIPDSAIDYNKARKLSTEAESTEASESPDDGDGEDNKASAFYLAQGMTMGTEDEDETSYPKDGDKEATSADEREEVTSVVQKKAAAETNDGEKEPAAAAASSPKRYLELLKDRNIMAFMVSIFFYHLSNAAVQPLVSQFIAIEDERNGMVFVSAIMLVFYFAQGVTAHWMIKAINAYNRKYLLITAHLVLPVQGIVIALLVNFWPNKYALTATQLMVGFSAGIFDTMIPVVVGTMTEGTGRYGFTFGFAITCWRLGHGFSVLLGESIVHASGYTAAFLTAAAIGVVSVGILTAFVRVDNGDNSKDEKKTQQQQVAENV